jgi:uncharacterized protein (DUF488 family)
MQGEDQRMHTLFTIGYQGRTIDGFIEALQAHGVTHLIDVRQLPFSRKPDFSKRRLQAHLAAAGIDYTHLVDLGTPKALRDEVRRSHNYEAFFAAMDALLAERPEALDAALAIARSAPAALLCFEADHRECHRLSVASAMQERAGEPLEVAHIG